MPAKPSRVLSWWAIAVRSNLYLAGGAFQRLSYLLLLPLLVVELSPAEFARFSLLASAAAILTPVLSQNLQHAPSRLWFDHDDTRDRASLLLTCATSSFGACAVLLPVIVVSIRGWGLSDAAFQGQLTLQLVVALVVISTVALESGQTILRIHGRAGWYAAISGIQGFATIALFVGLNSVVVDGLVRAILAVALSRALGSVLAIGCSASALRGGRYRASMLRGALSYSAPTAAHSLALTTILHSGQWIGAAFVPLEELARYTLLMQVTSALMMVSRAAYQARIPDIGKRFAAGELLRGTQIIRNTALVSIGAVLAAYAVIGAVLFWLDLRLPEGYQPSAGLLMLAALANVLDVLYLRGLQTLYALKRTRAQAFATIVAGAATIVAGIVLVRAFGVEGLMVALALGFGFQALLSNLAARRVLKPTGIGVRTSS